MQRIGDILRSFLAGKLTTEDESSVRLFEACRQILGDAGRHARVKDIRGRTLVLEVDHPGWAQLVSMRKAEILRRLGEAVPALSLRELRVVVGGGGSGGRPANPRRPRSAAPKGASADPDLPSALAEVRDEELRRSLRALYDQADDAPEGDRIDTGDRPGV